MKSIINLGHIVCNMVEPAKAKLVGKKSRSQRIIINSYSTEFLRIESYWL